MILIASHLISSVNLSVEWLIFQCFQLFVVYRTVPGSTNTLRGECSLLKRVWIGEFVGTVYSLYKPIGFTYQLPFEEHDWRALLQRPVGHECFEHVFSRLAYSIHLRNASHFDLTDVLNGQVQVDLGEEFADFSALFFAHFR